MDWHRDNYFMTDDPSRMNLNIICALINSTYWAPNRPREVIEKSVRHSHCFGVFCGAQQIGFGRIVTDYATVSYLCDVVMHPEHRGKGVGRWFIRNILEHPQLAGTRFDLFTKDAQEFYRSFGFQAHEYENMVRYPAVK